MILIVQAAIHLTNRIVLALLGGELFWSAVDNQQSNYYHYKAPADVEMTGYALMSYLKRKEHADAMKIVKWLSKQRNSFGGFTSTQVSLMASQNSALWNLQYRPYVYLRMPCRTSGIVKQTVPRLQSQAAESKPRLHVLRQMLHKLSYLLASN